MSTSASIRRVALVTGSTSGIGLAVARALAQSGCNVMLNGFAPPGGTVAAVVNDVASHGVEVSHNGADLSDEDQVAALVEGTIKHFGRLDILVNNAGIQHVSRIEDFPNAAWNRIIAINMNAVFYATKAALPGMYERGSGRIINISSVHGLVASANKSAYVAAKHGVVGLTKVTAVEAAELASKALAEGKPFDVTCNAIAPGWVRTELVMAQVRARAEKSGRTVEEEERALLTEKQPLVKWTTPEQIGSLIVWLCGDTSGSTTGATINMDGGWMAV